jgi:TonB family protein
MLTTLNTSCLGLVLALGLTAAVSGLHTQDWVPTRIVAITEDVPLAARARISGDVLIRCLLATDGSVLRADVLSGKQLLAAQAKENAVQWKFRRNKPEKNRDNSITLTYRYRLEGDSQNRVKTSFTVDLPDAITIIASAIYLQPEGAATRDGALSH